MAWHDYMWIDILSNFHMVMYFIPHIFEEFLFTHWKACRMGGLTLSQGDMAIFMLNNVSAIQHELTEALKRHANAASASSLSKAGGVSHTWFELLSTEASTWMGVLVLEEVTNR